MKLIITENKLKNFIENRLGIDLTDKIHMVTNEYELPKEFSYIRSRMLSRYLNNFGPMYVIETPKGKFLYQNQGDSNFVRVTITDNRDRLYSEDDIMEYLGIPPLGLKIDDLINIYI
jgi:hypothetical protein